MRSYIIRYFVVLCLFPGCAYRFTNEHVRIPKGIRSIAIEAVYDTSREVLPHEALWDELQKAFARDGHLRVVSQGRADALLRAHIESAAVGPMGRSQVINPRRDANTNAFPPLSPDDFRQLPQAGEYTTRERVNFRVRVEIIDLYSREVIFRKGYKGARNFRSAQFETSIQRKSTYLLYDEALETRFREISTRIAKNVVRDFLIGR